MTEKTCQERVQSHMVERMKDLRTLWDLYKQDPGTQHEDLGHIWEYGLGFDWVTPKTFQDQKQGFFRWQISTGGPGEEFRFFVNPDFSCYKVLFYFLDWFDSAFLPLKKQDESLILEIYEDFREMGICQSQFENNMGE